MLGIHKGWAKRLPLISQSLGKSFPHKEKRGLTLTFLSGVAAVVQDGQLFRHRTHVRINREYTSDLPRTCGFPMAYLTDT